MKRLLVTGGAGFIGSNFIHQVLSAEDCDLVVNLDALTYAGNLENLRDVEHDPRYQFQKGSICDRSLLSKLFEQFGFDTVVNFAAESHVDRSITNPELFLKTNIMGTQALLDIARKFWNVRPSDKYSREYKLGVRYLQVSTDEVYGTLGSDGAFTEETPLSPNSPYSASKAGADLIVRAYYKTFGLPVNITRCSNNYGPFQFPEKLIPLMILNCHRGIPLPVYGDGLQIRDWLHVFDHCTAIRTVLKKGEPGQVYNIGGNNERTNIEMVQLILKKMKCGRDQIKYVADRPGHDRRYAIDNSKITAQLGWQPTYTFQQGITETIDWYLANLDWMRNVSSGDYLNYYDSMYQNI